MAFDSRVAIACVGGVELVGVADPDEVWVPLDVVELSRQHEVVECGSRGETYQLQVEVSGNTEDVLYFTLLQSFDDVLCEFDGAHGGYVSVNVCVRAFFWRAMQAVYIYLMSSVQAGRRGFWVGNRELSMWDVVMTWAG